MRISSVVGLTAALMMPCGTVFAQLPPSNGTIRTKTRLITVDVVASDGHGNVVRGLTENDFKVFEEHEVQQDIAHFRFVDGHAMQQAGAKGNAAPGVFSNRDAASDQVAPTAILMDALNTGTEQQMQIRRDMLLYLGKLPANTPVAVFLLEHQLHMVQNFTTDPAILRAALQKAVANTAPKGKNPEFDPDGLSNVLLDEGVNPNNLKILEQFEKGQYEEANQQRAQETADAMRNIANYLRGYPGRKNLIWFSEAFPISIVPNSDFGLNPFFGTGSYESEVQAAAASLMEAGVAVYPVDARGLETSQVDTAEERLPSNKLNPELNPGGFGAAAKAESDERVNSEATLQQMAYETGGRVCENTNDMTGCVFRAINQDSSYYELSYYPTNVEWDNKFHTITIKTSVRDVHLDYRRGYIATNSSTLMSNENPDDILKDACREPLTSTAIGMTVTALPPPAGPNAGPRYLLTISPSALTFEPDAPSVGIKVKMAICEFDPNGGQFEFYSRDLSETQPASAYDSWKQNGIREVFGYLAKPADRRLRFAVVDLPSGETGSVDVLAHPTQFGALPEGASGTAPPSAPSATPPTHLDFRLPSGNVGTLDWSTGKLIYRGDLDSVVAALFNTIYGSKFHCEAGKLTPNQPDVSSPTFQLSFRSPSGLAAAVDFSGSAPVYSGDLPVDASAKAFFELLWKYCHCQAP
jgi:VWFA-related protein